MAPNAKLTKTKMPFHLWPNTSPMKIDTYRANPATYNQV